MAQDAPATVVKTVSVEVVNPLCLVSLSTVFGSNNRSIVNDQADFVCSKGYDTRVMPFLLT